MRRLMMTAAAIVPLAGALSVSGPAQASPAPIDDSVVVPGAPMPVPSGAFGYLATRDATVWLAAQRPADVIRSLPVPAQYRKANDALATQVHSEISAAVRTPGACVQIIIDPRSSAGNLFDYGVWSVERQYCPS